METHFFFVDHGILGFRFHCFFSQTMSQTSILIMGTRLSVVVWIQMKKEKINYYYVL